MNLKRNNPLVASCKKIDIRNKNTISEIIYAFSLKVFVAIFLLILTISNIESTEAKSISKQIYKNINIIVPKSSSVKGYPAKFLQKILKESLGQNIPIQKEQTNNKQINSGSEIHIGQTDYVKSLKLNMDDLDEDGFIIAFPAPKRIVIAAKTSRGMKYGIYEFLEKFIGVRWLFPGKLGEYIPKHNELIIVPETVRQEPVFKSRLLSLGSEGSKNKKFVIWCERNRMHGRVSFHHVLWKYFPPSKYGKTNPEYYPVREGRRFIPKGGVQIDWQPCFTAPNSINVVVNYIRKKKQQHPKLNTFSFGVNDMWGYCECTQCRKINNYDKNIQRHNSSNSYYAWCNAIIKNLGEPFQNTLFGCLAYFNVATPPQDKVADNLIPYIAYDRMQWIDPQREHAAKALLNSWNAKASTLGWYDYIYGKKYFVPRIYFHLMAEYIKYGSTKKVRHYYAEAYPGEDWKEGPKLYVTLKLLWNPNLDVDELLDDWYSCAVGAKAAPSLKAYYAFWEDFWCHRVLKSQWFKQSKSNTWLPFNNSNYLNLLTEQDIKKCELLLYEVKKNTITSEQKQRADHFLQTFLKIKENLDPIIKVSELEKSSEYKTKVIQKDDFSKKRIWTCWQRKGSHGKFSYNAKEGGAKPGCLEADLSGSTSSMVFLDTFTVEPGKIYQASVMVKIENAEHTANATIRLLWINNKGIIQKGIPGKKVTIGNNSKGWKKLKVTIIAPAKLNSSTKLRVSLGCKNSSNGKVYFDDFLLTEFVPK